jgi:DNA-binding beta-propeller fold protein YncE
MRSISPWLLLAACSGSSGKGYTGTISDGAGNDAPSDADTDADTDTDTVGTTAPGETEEEKLALPPAQTDVYVFVPNPERDTVTRLNVLSLAVDTVIVGDEPTIVKTSPDWRTAVAFNRGGDSVTIIDAETLATTTVPVRDDFNQMVMAPGGGWVVLWHDIASERSDDPPPSGLQSFNEASFVNVDTHEHFPMAVGFNPKAVVFTPDGSTAAVVSDQYLAVVDLTLPAPFPELIEISTELVDPPVAEEVVLAPDASYAFVRQFGALDLAVVDLDRKVVDRVPIGGNPTDLDLSPDGTVAAVVARDLHQLLLLSTDSPLSAPEIVDLPSATLFGSLVYDPTGDQAVLYTNASLIDRYATWEVGSSLVVERSLVKPVASLAITPTGESLLVFHTLEDVAGGDLFSPFRGEWAMTVISLADFRSNPLLLPGEPIGFANSSNGRSGYWIMEEEYWLGQIDYRTLLHEEIPLASLPEYVGVLPDLDPDDGDEPPAWASQDHPLGRITLYDPDTATTETITGFELNSEIED